MTIPKSEDLQEKKALKAEPNQGDDKHKILENGEESSNSGGDTKVVLTALRVS